MVTSLAKSSGEGPATLVNAFVKRSSRSPCRPSIMALVSTMAGPPLWGRRGQGRGGEGRGGQCGAGGFVISAVVLTLPAMNLSTEACESCACTVTIPRNTAAAASGVL